MVFKYSETFRAAFKSGESASPTEKECNNDGGVLVDLVSSVILDGEEEEEEEEEEARR